jgi:hypothetical protein
LSSSVYRNREKTAMNGAQLFKTYNYFSGLLSGPRHIPGVKFMVPTSQNRDVDRPTLYGRYGPPALSGDPYHTAGGCG